MKEPSENSSTSETGTTHRGPRPRSAAAPGNPCAIDGNPLNPGDRCPRGPGVAPLRRGPRLSIEQAGLAAGSGWRGVFLAATLGLVLLCGGSEAAAGVGAPSPSTAPRPVILIPGLMGSILEHQDTGHRVWGSYFRMRFVSPHRGLVDPTRDGLELPTASTTMRDNRDALIPAGLLERMTLIPYVVSVPVYRRWVKLFTDQGYVSGDIRHPRKGDTCFVVRYYLLYGAADVLDHNGVPTPNSREVSLAVGRSIPSLRMIPTSRARASGRSAELPMAVA